MKYTYKVFSDKALQDHENDTPCDAVKWEVRIGGEWMPCIRLGLDVDSCHVYQIASGRLKGYLSTRISEAFFRQVSSKRDKTIAAALECVSNDYSLKQNMIRLYDAGMLKIGDDNE
jgi:hypothetical protein